MPEQDPPDVDRGLRRALVVLGSMAVVFPLVWFVVLLAGVAAGYLWSRYRNVWANIAFHSVANTLPLMFLL
ncbi:MAG: hypothetical protein QG622_2405 [Actinomycetota bacterium]|nr:hypothetical protein [Actinomycetota bacterium]